MNKQIWIYVLSENHLNPWWVLGFKANKNPMPEIDKI